MTSTLPKYLVKKEPEFYCRTCLSECSDQQYSVFENNLKDVLWDVTSVKVNETDNFSKTICLECRVRVFDFFEFKNKVIKTQKYLMGLLDDVLPMLDDEKPPIKSIKDCVIKSEDHPAYDNTEDESETAEKIQRANRRSSRKGLKSKKSKSKMVEKRKRREIKKRKKRDRHETIATNGTTINSDSNSFDSFIEGWQKRPRPKDTSKNECPTCNKVLVGFRSYHRHLLLHEKYTCNIVPTCRLQCKSLKELSGHIGEVHAADAPLYRCDYCPRIFVVEVEYKRHVSLEEQGGTCEFCNETVEKRLNYHRRVMHCEQFKFHRCTDCKRKFKSENGLKEHRKLHQQSDTAADGIVCVICGLKFINMELHMSTKHNNDVKTDDGKEAVPRRNLKCRYCQQVFETRSCLFSHINKEHTRDQNHFFHCKLCPSKFTHGSSLRRHMAHLHEKTYEPIVCTICGHQSKTMQHSQHHMRVHTDERPFPCDLCARKFKNRGTLRDHRRTHTGERPHICQICQKGFCQRSALTTHLRMHFKTKKESASLQQYCDDLVLGAERMVVENGEANFNVKENLRL